MTENELALILYNSIPENLGFEPNLGSRFYEIEYLLPAKTIHRLFDVRPRDETKYIADLMISARTALKTNEQDRAIELIRRAIKALTQGIIEK